jgi:hypothetical protein
LIRIASKFLLRLPAEAEELKIRYSFQHAFLDDHPEVAAAVRGLIHEARYWVEAEKAHFFCFGLDVQDPHYRSIKKGAMFSNTAQVILDSRGQVEFEISHFPLHLEVALG